MNPRLERARAQRQGRPKNWAARMVSYLGDGVLLERVWLRWYYFLRRRRQVWWERGREVGRPPFVHSIQPGLRMNLHFENELCESIFVKGFETKERLFHNAFLRPGDQYVDIGANIGFFTLVAAQRVGPAGRVFAVEPVSETFRQLLANIELNGLTNITTCQIALSDTQGQAEIFSTLDGYLGLNSMAEPVGKNYTTEQVRVETFDHFVRTQAIDQRLVMVKMDVEGWESRVLAGGRDVFSTPTAPVLQVEFSSRTSNFVGLSSSDLYRLLADLGYRIFDYDVERNHLVPTTPAYVNVPYINLFAIKDPDFVETRLIGKSNV